MSVNPKERDSMRWSRNGKGSAVPKVEEMGQMKDNGGKDKKEKKTGGLGGEEDEGERRLGKKEMIIVMRIKTIYWRTNVEVM
jgi:hypothetical protein